MKISEKLSAVEILRGQQLANFTVSYLESLSTGELIEIAGKCGIDIPTGLERIFIIEELLYLNDDNDDEPVETGDEICTFEEIAILPKHYHISFIDVLVRDPLWVFVFWEIKVYDREQGEHTRNFESCCLRVIPLKEDSLQPDTEASFTVTVGIDDRAWYLGFPPDAGSCFKVELCVLNNGSYTVLAVSRPFKLPRLIKPNEDMLAVYENPLAQLSGVDRFSLVHSEEHFPRPRGT